MGDKTSFSYRVKEEICREFPARRCCLLAECYGILLYCNTFSPGGIRIVTEHPDFAARVLKLFRKAFGFDFDEIPDEQPESGKYSFRMTDPEKIAAVYAGFGLSTEDAVSLHLNRGVLENECCDFAFLRGAFLSGGSVIDPEKRYHLELSTTHQRICAQTYSLLLDVGFAPKDVVRNGSFVLYFKQSDQIEDFLTALDAPLCAMKIMEAKIEKQMRNRVNRVCNCDEANTEKMVRASREQLEAIAKLRASGVLESLPFKLQEMAALREQEPEAPLSELAQRLSLTKSAVNHRIRKLMELAKD